MQSVLNRWQGTATINNKEMDPKNVDFKGLEGTFHILLKPNTVTPVYEADTRDTANTTATPEPVISENTEYRIKVRQYMTKPASPDFDFQAKWNNNNPMPMRVMVGTKVKETRGMVYMKLHGDITQKITPCCMKCGRPIPNKISQYFGMGPECGGHNYTNPFNTEEELKNAVAGMRSKLQSITWEGWIIKSAIEEEDVVTV